MAAPFLGRVSKNVLTKSSPRTFLLLARSAGGGGGKYAYLKDHLPKPPLHKQTEEYPPWPDDGFGLGDYPNIPTESAQHRSPYGWWDRQDRRNFGEPLQDDDDALNMWVPDELAGVFKYSPYEAAGMLFSAFGLLGVVAFLFYLYDAPSRDPAIPRQYPFNNLYLEHGGDPSVENPPETPDRPVVVVRNYFVGNH